jgi:hypothetical protein
MVVLDGYTTVVDEGGLAIQVLGDLHTLLALKRDLFVYEGIQYLL